MTIPNTSCSEKTNPIDSLINGINILRKYTEERYFECAHDMIYFSEVPEDEILKNDLERLKQMGWWYDGLNWCKNC